MSAVLAKANADAESATARAWAVLEQVPDPEVPVVSVCDLGIVRDVAVQGQGVAVVLTPTYSGCPATEVIAQSVHDALAGAGFDPVTVSTRRAPAWTTGRRKLRAYGIAPPSGNAAVHDDGPRPIRIHARGVDCPRCGSSQTEKLSAFGSTACKALYRCLACREPFEYFKPI